MPELSDAVAWAGLYGLTQGLDELSAGAGDLSDGEAGDGSTAVAATASAGCRPSSRPTTTSTRSRGGPASCLASGPSPRPELPWHPAQSCA